MSVVSIKKKRSIVGEVVLANILLKTPAERELVERINKTYRDACNWFYDRESEFNGRKEMRELNKLLKQYEQDNGRFPEYYKRKGHEAIEMADFAYHCQSYNIYHPFAYTREK